jgi:hypothetical protein
MAIELPTMTGITAAANVLGRLARIHASNFEIVFEVDVIIYYSEERSDEESHT